MNVPWITNNQRAAGQRRDRGSSQKEADGGVTESHICRNLGRRSEREENLEVIEMPEYL
jgi:hypothetical protein